LPTYEYKCPQCGIFEEFQPISAPALEKCPTCGAEIRRLISRNVAVLYKGSGFYCTDYGAGTQSESAKQAEKEASAAS
jgi:putative FmdB family regulatory protein